VTTPCTLPTASTRRTHPTGKGWLLGTYALTILPRPPPGRDSATMCHGHPHHHPCGHQSMSWSYCVLSTINLVTGDKTPCGAATFAISVDTSMHCPLTHCTFKRLGGRWRCCVCHKGPNRRGWCTYDNPRWVQNHLSGQYEWVEKCDHGCCEKCTKYQIAPADYAQGD